MPTALEIFREFERKFRTYVSAQQQIRSSTDLEAALGSSHNSKRSIARIPDGSNVSGSIILKIRRRWHARAATLTSLLPTCLVSVSQAWEPVNCSKLLLLATACLDLPTVSAASKRLENAAVNISHRV